MIRPEQEQGIEQSLQCRLCNKVKMDGPECIYRSEILQAPTPSHHKDIK